MTHMSRILEACLEAHIKRIGGRRDLFILETGTIRADTPQHRDGDGWSTLTFARHVRADGGPSVVSIDLDTSVAARVLGRESLSDYVNLRQGYSIDLMGLMIQEGDTDYDVILLDSDNNADLILHEFMLAGYLLAPGGLILVDDVVPESATVVKGHKLIPYLNALGWPYQIHPRTGAGVQSGILSVIPQPRTFDYSREL